MSTTTGTNGRLCNQIIRNLAVNFIAKKHDLFVTYFNNDLINSIGINLYVGKNKYDNTIEVKNNNYMSILNKDKLLSNINTDNDYFQTKEVTNMICEYFKESINDIKSKNKFKDRYNNNNDLFIHIRLTDAIEHNPGLNYYFYCLSKIKYDNIYISTDDYNHNYIKKILDIYPCANLLYTNEVDTLHFGSTCKSIVLSHGSFSAVIGYLAFYSDVYYLNKKISWCPIDLFENKGWISVEEKDI